MGVKRKKLRGKGKGQLASVAEVAVKNLHEAEKYIEEAWRISKPYMENNNQ